MQGDEEYIAYRPDQYTHSKGISNLEDEFTDEKVLPNFKWNKFVNEYSSLDASELSFKRVKRQEDDEAPEAPPPPETPPDAGGDGTDGSPTEPKKFLNPIIGITAFFAIVFIIGPLLVRKGPNKGIIRCSIMIAAFCMWLFWVTVYIGQMNPLIGPRLHNTTIAWIAFKLGNQVKPPSEALPPNEPPVIPEPDI